MAESLTRRIEENGARDEVEEARNLSASRESTGRAGRKGATALFVSAKSRARHEDLKACSSEPHAFRPLTMTHGRTTLMEVMATTHRGHPGQNRVLYFVNEDWVFVSHWLGMAKAAKAAGFEVLVATRIATQGATIAEAGLRGIALEFERSQIGPVKVLREAICLRRAIAAERPAIVHAISLKLIILAALATIGSPETALIAAVTGLGYLWAFESPMNRLGRIFVRALFAFLRRRRNIAFLFENPEDAAVLGFDGSDGRVTVVHGAGVPPDCFEIMPDPPTSPLRVAVVARMIASKGIDTAVEAVTLARARGVEVELDLWGRPDPSNPGSFSPTELESWSKRDGIEWRGYTDDIAAVWRQCHAAVLLSRGGEGLPRALVEAAACGRPILTTDTAGCRDAAQGGRAGLLVPPDDPEAAADALAALTDPALRQVAGRRARLHFEENMSAGMVNRVVLNVYDGLARHRPLVLPATGLPRRASRLG